MPYHTEITHTPNSQKPVSRLKIVNKESGEIVFEYTDTIADDILKIYLDDVVAGKKYFSEGSMLDVNVVAAGKISPTVKLEYKNGLVYKRVN